MARLHTALLCSVIQICAFFPTLVNAEEFSYNIRDGYAYITGGNVSGAVVIPEIISHVDSTNPYHVTYYTVKGISSYAFERNEQITSVSIPNSVTEISGYAFSSCHGITSVSLGSSVNRIEGDAFINCTGLTSIHIPRSVSYIGPTAFYGCTGLTRVDIDDLAAWCNTYFSGNANPLYYAHRLYLNGEEITNLVIPQSVTDIKLHAFEYCTNLKSVTFHDGVKSIGYETFRGCTSLTSVDIPNSVTTIDNAAFLVCSQLKTVKIGSGLEKNIYSFAECPNIETLVIDNNDMATMECFNDSRKTLKTLVLGDNVTSIGANAFHNCSGLTSVTIPSSVTKIGNYAFDDCSGLTSIEIPNSVTKIGSSAFSGCSGLASMTIGNSVTSIGDGAFFGCTKLRKVYWNAKTFADYSSNSSTPFYNLTGIKTFNFGDGVEHIPAYLCYGLSGLTSVNISNTVTSIGDYAFYECGNLTSLELPNSLKTIGQYTFSNCSKLNSVTIPESITGIGYRAFYKSSALTEVKITDLTAWCNIAFDSFTSNPVYYSHHLYLNGDKVTALEIPNTITKLKKYAFMRCTDLVSLKIPNSVTSVERDVFTNCTSLETVSIPSSVSTFGINVFAGCSGLKSVTNHSETPQEITSDVFDAVDVSTVKLYVPEQSYDSYKAADVWKDFDIQGLVGVEDIEADENAKDIEGYYNLQGIRLEEPARGQINIVRYKDGTAKKVVN